MYTFSNRQVLLITFGKLRLKKRTLKKDKQTQPTAIGAAICRCKGEKEGSSKMPF